MTADHSPPPAVLANLPADATAQLGPATIGFDERDVNVCIADHSRTAESTALDCSATPGDGDGASPALKSAGNAAAENCPASPLHHAAHGPLRRRDGSPYRPPLAAAGADRSLRLADTSALRGLAALGALTRARLQFGFGFVPRPSTHLIEDRVIEIG